MSFFHCSRQCQHILCHLSGTWLVFSAFLFLTMVFQYVRSSHIFLALWVQWVWLTEMVYSRSSYWKSSKYHTRESSRLMETSSRQKWFASLRHVIPEDNQRAWVAHHSETWLCAWIIKAHWANVILTFLRTAKTSRLLMWLPSSYSQLPPSLQWVM